MDLDDARKALREGGPFTRLFEAVATVGMTAPNSVSDNWHLWLALGAPGVVGEQAMFALYRRTGRPLPPQREQLVSDPYQWGQWLAGLQDGDGEATRSRSLAGFLCALFDPNNGLDTALLQKIIRLAIQHGVIPCTRDTHAWNPTVHEDEAAAART